MAEFGCLLLDSQDVVEAKQLRTKGLAFRVLGAGSNVVPMPELKGLLGVMAITGVHSVDENDAEVLLEIGAGKTGMNWSCIARINIGLVLKTLH